MFLAIALMRVLTALGTGGIHFRFAVGGVRSICVG